MKTMRHATHAVWRKSEWTWCWCAADHDHAIGAEQ